MISKVQKVTWQQTAVILMAISTSFLLGMPRTATASPNVSITLQLVPKDVVNRQPSQLLMTFDSDAEVQNASLRITTPPCFAASGFPSTLPVFSKRLVQTATITPTGCDSGARELSIIAEVSQPGPPVRILSSQILAFTYATRITLWLYLLIGAFGVAIGYLLRLLVKVLAATTPPELAAGAQNNLAKTGQIGTFVKDHYYLTDFSVTLVLGILALLYLSHSTLPPDTASQWPGALTLGVSLGVLTNSELFTKLH